MTSIQIVLFIIAISTVFSIIYLAVVSTKKKTEKVINGLTMLICPLAGPIYFLGQYVIYKLLRKEKVLQLDDIGFSKDRHNRIANPNIDVEIQSVPLEEIFLVSANNEKRKHLLSELKKDYVSNYNIIIKALDNEDPETSHYAASAITSAKADFENDLKELDSLYSSNMNDMEILRQYSDYVYSYLKSGILDKIESRKYSYLLINLLTRIKQPEQFLNEKDYSNIVNESIILNEFTIAEHWAKFSHEILKNESSYMNLLKLYYATNRMEQFFELLNDMKKSNISLSYNGLSLVRFFISPKSKSA